MQAFCDAILPFEGPILCICFLENSVHATDGIYRNDKHPTDNWRLGNKDGDDETFDAT